MGHTLWNKADYQRTEQKITEVSETFHADFSIDTPVQHLWDAFKFLCHHCLSLIPHKTVSNSCKPPWITRYIKRLSNKEQHVYNRARLSGSGKNINNFKEQSRKSVGSLIICMFQNCSTQIIIMVINIFGLT